MQSLQIWILSMDYVSLPYLRASCITYALSRV